MRSKYAMIVGGCVASLAVSAASQQSAPDIPDALLNGFQRDGHIEDYVARVVGELRQADRAEDGLDQGDIDFAMVRRGAQQRAGPIQKILPMDLDGDLRITRAEIGLSTSPNGAPDENEANRNSRIDHHLGQYDIDGDGVITLPEAAATARHQAWDYRLVALLALDPDGDGKLTAGELLPIAERAFRSVDSNGDGQTTEPEIAPIMGRIREMQMTWQADICTLPPVPAAAKLIAYGGYESGVVSPIQIESNDKKRKTRLVDVTIEPGVEPLYLVLTSYETTFWRLLGATNRVTNVVVSSYRPARGSISAAGVGGVAVKKITVSKAGCPNYFSATDEDEAKRARASIRLSLRRDPDAMFADYAASRISLPSGAIAATPDD